MYDHGEGTDADPEEARRWYREAALQGDDAAQYQMGWIFDIGHGVPEDNDAALRWYRKAGAQGNTAALYNMAIMFDTGDGVAVDQTEAARLYGAVARLGDPDAQYLLGEKYAYGTGVAKDFETALMWLAIASENGSTAGATFSDVLSGFMVAEDIARAKARAERFRASDYADCD